MVRTAVVNQMHDMANSIMDLQVTTPAETNSGSGLIPDSTTDPGLPPSNT
jgi:hypothetical protein